MYTIVADARTRIESLALKTMGWGGGPVDPDVPSWKIKETESGAASCWTSAGTRLMLNVVVFGDVAAPVVGLTVAPLIR